MDKILKLAERFESLAKAKTSMQAGDIQDALEKADLWGGKDGGFDPNSKTADKVFKVLDKYAPETGSFKINATLKISSGLAVKVEVDAPKHANKISRELSAQFGPEMKRALKQLSKKMSVPPEPVELKWLKNVGY